jgi:hypothetical protein
MTIMQSTLIGNLTGNLWRVNVLSTLLTISPEPVGIARPPAIVA